MFQQNDSKPDRRPSIAERATQMVENLKNSSQNLNEPAIEELSMNIQDYDLQNVIGHGSSAVVYLAKYKPLNKQVAIKVIDCRYC